MRALLILILMVVVSFSAARAEEPALVVFAASSLTDVFKELGVRLEMKPGGRKVTFAFGASNELRMQLEHGAAADVFAPASDKEMGKAYAAGLVDDAETFARNSLVVVTPAANPGKVSKLEDLARPGLKVLLAHPNVPAGGYALEMLDKVESSGAKDFRRNVQANVVSQETNVRQVIAKIALGEADAGVVYRSDITPKVADKVHVVDVPAQFNVVASYPIAVVKASKKGEAASAFLGLVLSAEGQAVLQKANFERASK